jgi:lysophospholipase L1-like esterase
MKHILTVLLASTSLSLAQAPNLAMKPPGLNLKDGDRWVFVGDSITHQCQYTQYVENFYFTRHPGKRIHFRNAGISGDRAADVLARFDDDIAAFKPTIATVLLGMNDGSYKDFDAAVFKTYSTDMLKLMDKLDALKCQVILMSPTMFDHKAWAKRIQEKPEYAKGRDPSNYNAVLAYYGKWLQEVAQQRGYRFVDLYGPLNTFTVAQRQSNPDFTLVPDAIHPEADGQFVMAYNLLRQCGEVGPVMHAGVKMVNGAWAGMGKGVVANVSGEPGRTVSFTATPSALPWAQFVDCPVGTKLTISGHQGGSESYIAVGLEPGYYDLVVNGALVGTYDEKMLGIHAEVQEDLDSPTCQQALKVIALNKQRNSEAVSPMRGIYAQRKGKLRAARAPGGDMAAFEAWWTENKKLADDLAKKADELAALIYQINQPQKLKVEIKPGQAPAPKIIPKPKAKGKAKAA